MSKAIAASGSSSDRSTKVGAVIANSDGEVLAMGANSFPAGVSSLPDGRHQRPNKYLWIEHAERNAIYAAAKSGIACDRGIMYLPWFPCAECARAIIQSGIRGLVAFPPKLDDLKWGESFNASLTMLEEAGVTVTFLDPETFGPEKIPSSLRSD